MARTRRRGRYIQTPTDGESPQGITDPPESSDPPTEPPI